MNIEESSARTEAASGGEPRSEQTTCCIVGAGPAGAVLALLLARKGVAVALLELHADFERDFRGDTIHPSVMENMDEIGLTERLLQLRHTKIHTFNIMATDGGGLTIDLGTLKTKYPFITMLPQADFLEFITNEAKQYPHFQLLMEANVQELIEEDGAVRGVRYEGGDNRLHEIRAALTIGADGRSSRVRRLAGMQPVKTAPPMDVLWFRLPRRETDGMGAMGKIGRGNILVMLDRAELWQIAYIIPKGTYQQLRAAGLEEVRRHVAELAPALSDRVEHLKDWKQVSMLSVESSRVRRWYKPGLLLIGDAAHVMSPVGGVGINYAIQDAVVAANVLTEPLRTGTLQLRHLRSVQNRRVMPTRIIQRFQAFLQRRIIAQALDTARPFTPPAILRVPFVQKIIARIIGFGVWRVHVKA